MSLYYSTSSTPSLAAKLALVDIYIVESYVPDPGKSLFPS